MWDPAGVASNLRSRLRRAKGPEADGETGGETGTSTDTGAETGAGGSSTPRARRDLRVWRARLASVLWTVCVLLALVLAIGALLVAIEANEDNGLVSFVLSAADGVDLGVFSRENGVREFTGANAETKNALFNWGLGAVVYLVLGRLLERLVRPGR